MRVHFVQHVPFEGPALIAELLTAGGASLSTTRTYEDASFPDPEDFDRLVVMGGPMGVADAEAHPWLRDEEAFLRRVAALRKKKVLGVCLGAQLAARALGAEVGPNPQREIGFHPVYRSPAVGGRWERLFPPTYDPLHWHGDTFSLPKGAVCLAYSAACANQAFAWKNRVLGLQFHLECTEDSLRAMIAHGAADFIDGGRYVHDAKRLLDDAETYLPPTRKMLERLLKDWFR